MDLASENSYNTPFANTTIMPLLLLSLLQQKNAPHTKDTFKKKYDFIIVGAGSAGSVLAARLSEVPCVSVLLLEAGKSPPLLTEVPMLGSNFYDSDISWPYETTPQQHSATAMVNRQVAWPSGMVLGGSSVLNGMAYVRGDMRVYDEWARLGALGWSASEVRPYFLKLENYSEPEYLANGYHAVGGPVSVERPNYSYILMDSVLEAATELGYDIVDTNAQSPRGFHKTELTSRNGQRCSTAKAYLVPAENRTNLDIVTNALVLKVLMKNGCAEGVQFEHGGEVHEVRAKKEVILSAGTVNSAQLLMLSGIGPEDHLTEMGIPVIADLPVGKNFLDNCGTFLFYELDQSEPNLVQKLFNISNVEDYIDNRRGIFTGSGANPLAFLGKDDSDHVDFQLIWGENVAPSIQNDLRLKPEVVRAFDPYLNKTLYTCFPQFMTPLSSGRVTLRSPDPHDPPLIDPNFYEHDKELHDIVAGMKVCQRIASSEAMKKIGSKPLPLQFPGCEDEWDGGDEDEYLGCVARAFLYPLSHQVGTAKMGHPKDPDTVVDPRLRVKGVRNLRVVDASVMPLIPTGNTNIPTIMVAEKAADIIKTTLDCYPQY